MDKGDDIVKVKRSDLQGLIDTNMEAYNLLDEIVTASHNVSDKVSKAFKTLEDAPTEVSDIIVEDEDES